LLVFLVHLLDLFGCRAVLKHMEQLFGIAWLELLYLAVPGEQLFENQADSPAGLRAYEQLFGFLTWQKKKNPDPKKVSEVNTDQGVGVSEEICHI